jgi:ABC-type lipoprotein export system ATPase subunit
MTANATTASVWPRGSEWRKWDLHVHSPISANFQGDWNGFIIQLGNADCEVVGINDYFSVEGYKEVLRRLADPTVVEGNKAYREALEKLKTKAVLPVVECRMTNVVIGKKGTGPSINFHLIFEPFLSLDDIERFIKNLQVKGQSIGTRYGEPKFLLDDCQTDFFHALKALRDDETFRDKVLIWIPYDEYGGIGDIDPQTDALFKENLVFNADVLGSSNKKQADFFLWKDSRFPEADYKKWFGRRKPCIKGSDSHNMNDEVGRLKDHNSQPIEKYCWIKADPTFGGLRQIINEPEGRVHIGRCPPKMAEVFGNSTRFLDSATIRRRADSVPDGVWFGCEVPLNADMVAIIGNKGSGKSALADVLALAGNAHCDTDHYSFLTKERFCERNGRIAKHFEIVLRWRDGSSVTRSLFDKPLLTDVERVKYIPQTYLEKICTETAPGEESEFQSELRKVIFSHISEADRLHKETLDELIEYKTEELREQLATHRTEISALNNDIVRLEIKGSDESLTQLSAQRKLKAKELEVHMAAAPAIVEQPTNLPAEQQEAAQQIASQLEAERIALTAVEADINTRRERQRILTEHIAIARKIDGKLTNFESEYQKLVQDTQADLRALSLTIDTLVTVTVNRTPLVAATSALTAEKTAVDSSLSPDDVNGLPREAQAHRVRIKELQERLDAPSRRYQEYLGVKAAWEQRKQTIEGTADKADTLAYIDAQIEYIKTKLPAELQTQKDERTKVARKVHKAIASIRDVYKELFASVQQLIEDSVIIREGFKLKFVSTIVEQTFERDFFEKYVNQGVAGSFCGKEKGTQRLEEIRAEYDFNDEEHALQFIEKILINLAHDLRTAAHSRIDLAAQLRKHVTAKEVYDYLWSMDYLEPEYSLRLDGKKLRHLSPGERGTLLLVFYLLVDKSRCPIIVDQPEENLDNHTVYKLLIPVIKDVKARRQLIMVTHSPNIAVVCDAEQIIHAFIDREDGNRVVYTMGAIEAPTLNRHVINVLEGTRPAFDNRGSKYLPD